MVPFMIEAVEAAWAQKKSQMVDQALIPTAQDPTEHQLVPDLSKNRVKAGLYFVSNPDRWPCRSCCLSAIMLLPP